MLEPCSRWPVREHKWLDASRQCTAALGITNCHAVGAQRTTRLKAKSYHRKYCAPLHVVIYVVARLPTFFCSCREPSITTLTSTVASSECRHLFPMRCWSTLTGRLPLFLKWPRMCPFSWSGVPTLGGMSESCWVTRRLRLWRLLPRLLATTIVS